MDTHFQDYPISIPEFIFEHEESHYHSNSENNQVVPNPNPISLIDSNLQNSSPSFSDDHSEDSDHVHDVLKYINDMLMEEDVEEQTWKLQDSLSLQATEKSLYEVIAEHYTPSTNQSFTTDDTIDRNLVKPICVNGESQFAFPFSLPELLETPESSHFAPPVLTGNLLRPSSEEGRKSLTGSRGRRGGEREEVVFLEDERNKKLSADSLPELEQPGMFDDVLLCEQDHEMSANEKLQENKLLKGSRRSKRWSKVKETVDLTSLLTLCAQAAANFDIRTAKELLNRIRQHCDQFGNGTQRMAYYFTNALELRLSGTKTPVYSPILSNRASASDILKAYKVYVTACPFKNMSTFYTNKTILKLAEKATSLHIIEFGILYGFKWPGLIQKLSVLLGGPPKLRITGIELPQPGFRPTQRVEETGRRLKRYCERFHVPFEYNFIVKKWETIELHDLKLDKNETTVVTCLYRMKSIPDDTVLVNSPRDTVLNLIKSIDPDVFVHGVVNATYNAPFFSTRFREALHYFSALFDMFDATVPRENRQRMLYEREILGRDSMNLISCEDMERVERPETLKQWQVRNLRAGFKPVPLDKEILKKVTSMVKSGFHREFFIDVDGQWMLQGWKGRAMYGLSCWKPVGW